MQRSFRVALATAVVVVIVYGVLFAVFYSNAQANGFSKEHSIVGSADSAEYVALARTMLETGRFALSPDGEAEYFRTPMYPLFIAKLLFLFGNVLAIPISQIVLVGLSAALIYAIGTRFFPTWIAIAAAVLYALDPGVIMTSFVSLSDTLFVFLLCAAIYGGVQRDWRWVLLAGACTGLLVLTRPVGLYVIPLLGILIALAHLSSWQESVRRAAIFLCTAAIIFTPWMTRNASLSGHFTLSSLGPYNILFFNVLDFEATRRGIDRDTMRTELYEKLGVRDWVELRSLRYADAERQLTREYLAPHFLEYTMFHLIKTIPFFVASSIESGNRAYIVFGAHAGELPPDVNVSALIMSGQYAEALKALTSDAPKLLEQIAWVFAWVLALYFVCVSLYRNHSHRWVYATFFLLCLAFAILTGPIAMPRYRMPVEPLVFLLAAGGAHVAYSYAKPFFARVRALLSTRGKAIQDLPQS